MLKFIEYVKFTNNEKYAALSTNKHTVISLGSSSLLS